MAPEAAARIAKDSPDTRLIVLLREPVGRAHSAWSMYRKFLTREPDFFQRWNRRCFADEEIARFVPRSAEEIDDMHLAVEREIDCLQRGQRPEWSVVEYGLYGPQLQHYRNYFPAENFLILNAKSLYDQVSQTLAHICKELDLDEYPWHEQDFKRVHVGDYSTTPQMLPRTRELLESFYAESNRTLASEWSLDAEWLPSHRA